jgi:hypothetical protein
MALQMNDLTREELHDFLQHPGWQWFSAYMHSEWGESAFGLRVAEVLRVKPYETAAPIIQQITVAKQEIAKLFAAPKEKLDGMNAQTREKDARLLAPGRRPVGL